MSDDLERLLGQFRRRGAPAALRPRVLGVVEQELRGGGSLGWGRWYAAVAAALLLGVGLNYVASTRQEERLAQVFGPPPVPHPIAVVARAIEPVTDAETARSLERQWCQAYWQHQKQVLHKRNPGAI